ncbi:alpha-L-fucosidase [Fulvivirga sp. M361]|uniref:alpha-L-fucosidase n=1 Tax=Fulvivirga sp. M361 TaxID=2594266 RepID=UPI00117995C9|nr:alpha-L-fucosidase [Fulvivirga sp. M361]TRX57639.1 alpha-L-fucosidase [Fulvivirga sp. M361]
MKFSYLYISLTLLVVLGAYAVVDRKFEDPTDSTTYEANWESLKKYETPAWFQDAKLGIFIHWGPYSVPAFSSEWYGRHMYMDTANFSAQLHHKSTGAHHVYEHHLKTWGDPKEFGYKDFIPMFKGEKFDADEWISIFKKSGAKYVVPVAEHHDGFAMYDSKITRWNSVDMGPKRDILKELMSAGKKEGLKVGASSHYAFNWTFFNKKKHFDTMDPEYADFYGRKITPLSDTTISKEFLDTWMDRVVDLVDNYQPDILWFDFFMDQEEFVPYHPKLAAYYYNKGLEWNKGVVLQNKNFGNFESFPKGTNVLDLERGKMSDINRYPWQTDTSIGKNSWCYVEGWDSKTPNTIVDDLIDIVSKNGNLLLNVGPKADGTIPEDQQAVLFELGDWLHKNGEAIYGSRPWVVFGEGPTKVATGHHTEGENKDLTSADFRFTAKGDNIYAIAMDFNANGKYRIKSLSKDSKYLKAKKIKKVELLDGAKKVKWEQTSEGLLIKMDPDDTGKYACAFKVSI